MSCMYNKIKVGWIFSNSSFMLSTSKYLSQIKSNSGHSIIMCFRDKSQLHGIHPGTSFPLRRCICVRWLCPIRMHVKILSWRLTSLHVPFHLPNTGCISCRLFWSASSQIDCYLVWSLILMDLFKSLYGMGMSVLCRFKPSFAAWSAASLPFIPISLGIQQKTSSFSRSLYNESCLPSIFCTTRCFQSLYVSACSVDLESENITDSCGFLKYGFNQC